MKKILHVLILVCIAQIAIAQTPCVPGTITSPNSGYILPDSATGFNHGCAGKPYEQIIYMKAPKDTTFYFGSIPITAIVDSFVVDANIVGLPAGLTVTGLPGILAPAAGSPKTNISRMVLPGDSLGCVKISGILPASLAPGDINLIVNIRGYLDAPGFGKIDTPIVVDYYKITIDAPGTGACNPASTNDLSMYYSNFSISPNPAFNYLNISFDAQKNSDAEFVLYSSLGQKVLTEKVKINIGYNKLNINTGEVPAGIYYLELRNQHGILSKNNVMIKGF